MKTLNTLALSVMLLFGGSMLQAQKLSSVEKKIVEKLKTYDNESIAFLEKVVNINSGTMNLAGVKAMGREFDAAFSAIDFTTQWIEMPADMNRASHSFGSIKGKKGKNYYSLVFSIPFLKPIVLFRLLNVKTALHSHLEGMT